MFAGAGAVVFLCLLVSPGRPTPSYRGPVSASPEEGMRALERGGVKEGGVIIFLTDGQQECAVRKPLIGL